MAEQAPVTTTTTLFGMPAAPAAAAIADTASAPPIREDAPRMTTRQLVGYVQAEQAAGRHSSRFQTVCDKCREWVDGIWYVTFDGKRLCYACAKGKPSGTPAPRRIQPSGNSGGTR